MNETTLLNELENSIEAVKGLSLKSSEANAIATILENNTAYGQKNKDEALLILSYINMYFHQQMNYEDFKLLDKITYDSFNNDLNLEINESLSLEKLNSSNNDLDMLDFADKALDKSNTKEIEKSKSKQHYHNH